MNQTRLHLEPGESLSVWRNQGDRDAIVLAVRADRALINYEMPSGVEYLNILDLTGDLDVDFKAVSVSALSAVWKRAVEANGLQEFLRPPNYNYRRSLRR